MTIPTSETSPHRIYARVAGFTLLYCIAAGISVLALDDRTPVTDLLSLSTSFAALGEVLFILWLLIKGVDVEQWQKRVLESA